MTPPDLVKSPTLRLLLVDDNQLLLDLLAALLQIQLNPKPNITMARTGAQALSLAEALQPHAALVDLTLPDLSGLETITRLREMLPDTRIIALTMLPDEPAYQEAVLTAGANDMVSQSRLISDLRPIIRRLGAAVP